MKENKRFLVLFWGKFIPLQGVSYIRAAAEILKGESDMEVRLIGGETYLPYEQLVPVIKTADICLGIFGDTDKAQRVIPNKVYEAFAMRKPVISGDSPAIHEMFLDHENIVLCKMADAEDLAKKILELKNDPALRECIAASGHALYLEKLKPEQAVLPLVNYIHEN